MRLCPGCVPKRKQAHEILQELHGLVWDMVEAPGVECAKNPLKTKDNGLNTRQGVVTKSGKRRPEPISWDEFVTAVTRAKKQIAKARKVLEAGDKAVADEVLAKVERDLERMMRRFNATSK